MATQEKNNTREINLQRMTKSSKQTVYRECRRRANKICREKKREMLKTQIESIKVDRERAETRKFYQTLKRFRKGFQSDRTHLKTIVEN
jgi:hypothetical protein